MRVRKSALFALLYVVFATGYAFSINYVEVTNDVSSHPLYPYFLVGNQPLASMFWGAVWGIGFVCALVLAFNTRIFEWGQPKRGGEAKR